MESWMVSVLMGFFMFGLCFWHFGKGITAWGIEHKKNIFLFWLQITIQIIIGIFFVIDGLRQGLSP